MGIRDTSVPFEEARPGGKRVMIPLGWNGWDKSAMPQGTLGSLKKYFFNKIFGFESKKIKKMIKEKLSTKWKPISQK